jgi:uncharacterized protein (UPF0212 family)
MSATRFEFFTRLPCPKCGQLTFGAVVVRIGDMVATATDMKHFEKCGMEAQAQHEENVERAYLKATGER